MSLMDGDCGRCRELGFDIQNMATKLGKVEKERDDLRAVLEALTSRAEMCLRGVAEYVELHGLVHNARDVLDSK